MTATKEQDQPRVQAHTSDTCPNCGYCPHCGQSRQQAVPWYPYVPIPYVPPVRPWTPTPWIVAPQITWSGTGTYTAPNTGTIVLS